MSSVLVLNAGSSTLKASVVGDDERALASVTTEMRGAAEAPDALARALDTIAAASPRHVLAVGHRVVHGGARFTAPASIDALVFTGGIG